MLSVFDTQAQYKIYNNQLMSQNLNKKNFKSFPCPFDKKTATRTRNQPLLFPHPNI